MAVIKCLQRYEEKPNCMEHGTITGDIIRSEAYPIITPAEFLVISSEQEELRKIGYWVQENDLDAIISVTDSVDGINHSFTITMYEKEAIVLFMLIWA